MNDTERERLLRQLNIGPIFYPSAAGCAGSTAGSGAPSSCQGEVTAAAEKHYQGPKRPHYARIYLCALHARLEAAGPLTDADRAELDRRRAEAAYWEQVRARQAAAR